MANENKKPALYLAEYDTPNALAGAAMKVRDAGYQSWDCHTPYPMHGIDEAMGLKPTRIGIISFIFGMLGVGTAVLMMQYTNAWSADFGIGAGYPIVVGGKPPGAFPSMVPDHVRARHPLVRLRNAVRLARTSSSFRVTIIPIFESDRFEAATDDKFFISIEADDKKFDLDRTKALLESTNPTYLELVEEEVL